MLLAAVDSLLQCLHLDTQRSQASRSSRCCASSGGAEGAGASSALEACTIEVAAGSAAYRSESIGRERSGEQPERMRSSGRWRQNQFTTCVGRAVAVRVGEAEFDSMRQLPAT